MPDGISTANQPPIIRTF